MATVLQGSADNVYDGGPEFAQVFVIVWIGAMIVTLNSKLLGGNMYEQITFSLYSADILEFFFLFFLFRRSFFQSVCVLGYCLAPVAGALIVCKVLLIAEQTRFVFFLRLVSTLVGFIWATYGTFKT